MTSVQRGAERVGGGVVILLIEKGFAHAEVGQGAIGLNGKSALVLPDRVVIAALLGKLFAAGDGGAGTEGGTALQDQVVRINLDAAGLWATEGFDSEFGVGTDDVNRFYFGIAFGIDAEVNRHAEGVERVLDLADHTETLVRAVDNVFNGEVRNAGGIEPLR